jgi:hypothetical protein
LLTFYIRDSFAKVKIDIKILRIKFGYRCHLYKLIFLSDVREKNDAKKTNHILNKFNMTITSSPSSKDVYSSNSKDSAKEVILPLIT